MHVTLHTLTRDIPNPLSKYIDKRRHNGWMDLPEIAKHQRFLIVKSFPEKRPSNDGSTWRTVRIAKAVSRSDADPYEEGGYIEAWYEVAKADGTVELHFRGDLEAESCRKYGHARRDLKHAEAKAELCKALAAHLSAPIRDFRTAFLDQDSQPASTPADVLHHLYLAGVVTLDMIAAAHKAINPGKPVPQPG